MTAAVLARIWILTHSSSDRGASLVEYALLIALIALVLIGAVSTLGGSTASRYSDVSSQLG